MENILGLQGLKTEKGGDTDGVMISTQSNGCGNSSASVVC